ncbi:MAG: VapE family protein [Thiobacillus sp.]|nr:VapE family protein [Thiobacillus sp.]MDP2978549.1 VapE family protein [Thiobacillus sp.]
MEKTTSYAKVFPDPDTIEAVLLPALGKGSLWGCWRVKGRGPGVKPAKVPNNGQRNIQTDSPGDWLPWDKARMLYESNTVVNGYDGVGVLMSSLSGVVGIDVDKCLEGGEVKASAAVVDAVEAMGGYVEVSPSGTGLRAFVFGVLPDGCKERAGEVEIYSPASTRYLTVTGQPWSRVGVRQISENQPAIDDFLARFGFLKSDSPEIARPLKANVGGGGLDDEFWPDVTDDEVMRLLRVNNKRGLTTRLWAGKLDDAKGDHSTADYMLCCQIANYTCDEDQIDRLFRQSGLMRPKWDEKRGKGLYGSTTIYRAVDAVEKEGENHWSRQTAKTAERVIERAQAKGIQERATELLEGGLTDLADSKGKLRQNVHVWSQLLYRDRRFIGAVWFDEFAHYTRKTPVFSQAMGRAFDGEALTDDDILGVAVWLAREWGINIKPMEARSALLAWAGMTRRNPVTEKLDALADGWDGVPRLDRWLVDYCGASDAGGELAEYLAAVGSRWVLGVVARAYGPAKVDCMLILEGRQGAGKSTAARILAEAIAPSCFVEGFELNGGKDSLLGLRGRLIAEWAELSGLSKHDSETLKNFLSKEVDSYRDPYGMITRDFPRTCCFLGTSNENVYLRDVTGNRRFWPVQVGRVDTARLRQDAPQLWGEAVHRFRQRSRWWIDGQQESGELLRIITREQQARLVPDAWAEVVEDFGIRLASGLVVVEGRPRGVHESWRFIDLAHAVLGTERADALTPTDERRLQTALKRAGWENFQSAGRGKWRTTKETAESLAAQVR